MERIQTFQTLSGNFEQEVLLGDRLIQLTVSWNGRSEAWYMSVEDVDSNDIINSIKIVPNWLLIKQYRAYLPNFEGDIMATPTDIDIVGQRVTYDNLNNGYELAYLLEEEVEAWEEFYGLG